MEAYKYPIFVWMYHFEFQINPNNKAKLPTLGQTDEISLRLSSLLNKLARTNTNKIESKYQNFMTHELNTRTQIIYCKKPYKETERELCDFIFRDYTLMVPRAMTSYK